MLSRTSSRVRLPIGRSSEGLRDVLEAVGVVVQHPGGEGDRGIGQAVERLRAIRHLHRVADALGEEEAQPVVRSLLVGRQPGRGRIAAPEDVRGESPGHVGRDRPRHVGVDAEQLRRRLVTHGVGDLGAPVAALSDVPGVAEPPHQGDPRIGDANRSPAGRGRLARVAVPGHRRHDHVERVRGIAAVRGRIAERPEDVEHLEDRTRPAVRDDQRQRVRVRRLDLDEVDVDPVDLGDELRHRVQSLLDPSEVVVAGPVARQLLDGRQRHAL